MEHTAHTWWKAFFISSFAFIIWFETFFHVSLYIDFLLFRAAHNVLSFKCVVNPISYAWRWINCFFSIPSLLTLTHYVSSTKWKINKCEKLRWNVREQKVIRNREDTFSFPFHQPCCSELRTHWIWTKFIHFNRNNWFNVKWGREKKLFFSFRFVCVGIICRSGDFLSMCTMAYLSK